MLRFVAVSMAAFLSFCAVASAQEPVSFEKSTLILHTMSGDHALNIELARTEKQRERGLMYRDSLDAGYGMLFDFGGTRNVSMWMANTRIPLDMLFIDRDGVVASIYAGAEPYSKRIISSGGPVAYVLELPGGDAGAYSVVVGDTVSGADIGSK
ncbi:DUF192 domain-containing protein [Martelella alba]|uniref:DUF192 domain-containing protein n=1 Tax=Martelella alba TaxID=2590451 RepID=A0A506U5S8_9HYPH|nr:DUF192 domain-containing protein [Martelella alba]TPW29713.1 DUF192 domain-containing protein [Martelella alba]